MEHQLVQYVAEPTAEMFHADRWSFVKAVMGPYGSGKSTMCMMDLLMLAQEQEPFRGVRRVRTCVVRNTYPELKSTTIKTWQEWIPDSVMPIKFDAPISGRMRQLLPDGTVLDWEVLFLALDRPDHVGKLKSLDLTNAYVNEASEVPWAIIEHLTARVDRFPPAKDVGATLPCVIMDTNPPDDDSKFHETFEVLRPEGYRIYYQPPALVEDGDFLVPNPEALYARFQNSGYRYWLRMAAGKTKEWIKVYIFGQYGSVFTGKPVYQEYHDDIHYSPEPLEVYPGLPLIIGMDFGIVTTAATFHQLLPNGQLRLIDELIGNGIGIRQFARDALRPHLMNNYPAGMRVLIVGDPAGLQRSQVSDEETCLRELKKQGFEAVPAHTNSPIARREAVAGYLTGMTRDGEPAFVIGPNCPVMRKALMGGYQFARVAVSGDDERFRDEPVKNRFSHPADANQYAALWMTKPMEAELTKAPVVAQPVRKVRHRSV